MLDKRALLLVVCIAAIGCGPNNEAPPSMDPKAHAFQSELQRIDPALIESSTDLKTYPGATVIEANEEVSPQIPPDEKRFKVTYESNDSVDKVAAFYAKALDTQAINDKDARSVMGRTPKGNAAIVNITPDGEGSKINVSIIAYASGKAS